MAWNSIRARKLHFLVNRWFQLDSFTDSDARLLAVHVPGTMPCAGSWETGKMCILFRKTDWMMPANQCKNINAFVTYFNLLARRSLKNSECINCIVWRMKLRSNKWRKFNCVSCTFKESTTGTGILNCLPVQLVL